MTRLLGNYLRQTYIPILMALEKRNRPVQLSVIVRELGANPAGFYRPLKKLLEEKLVVVDIDQKDKRRRVIQITENGRVVLRYNNNYTTSFNDLPAVCKKPGYLQNSLDEQVEKPEKTCCKRDRVVNYTPAVALWKVLRLYSILVRAGERQNMTKGNIYIATNPHEYFYNDECINYAIPYFVDKYRNWTDISFCPVVIERKKGEWQNPNKFIKCRCLWFSKNLDASLYRGNCTKNKRIDFLNKKLMEYRNLGFSPSIVIDGGFTIWYLFLTQNPIRSEAHYLHTGSLLAERFYGDFTAKTTQCSIPVPETWCYKRRDNKSPLKALCKIAYFDHKAFINLEQIDRLLGYEWDYRFKKPRILQSIT